MTNSANLNPALDRIRKMLAERNASKQAAETNAALLAQHDAKHIPFAAKQDKTVSVGESDKPVIVWNEQQKRAIELAQQGESFCLIGAAGTGKTTAVREVVRVLRDSLVASQNGKLEAGTIALVAFTNRAVRNIRKSVKEIGAESFCSTVHKFLRFQPEWLEYEDEDGFFKKTMRFMPTFHEDNPILHCKLVVVDESSMLDTRLHAILRAACPNAIFIYIGDLNQLTPVFGDAILGYKLDEVPVCELTQVYRQALESPIIWFQHNYTLAGKIPSDSELVKLNEKFAGKGLHFKPFKQQFPDGEHMAEAVANYMIRQMQEGNYDPELDTILIPYNKSFGSDGINIHIAEYLAKRDHRVVHEIIAGFNKHYYAVDDFVMYDKRECTIVDIKENKGYFGASPQPPSMDMSRFGYIRTGGKAGELALDHVSTVDFDALLNATASDTLTEDSERKAAASHEIILRDNDTGEELIAKSAGEVNSMNFGFAMTIHKSQGSEWRKVWLVVGKQHRGMLTRELLYTGMTRAREYLEVIHTPQTAPGRKDNSVARAIKSQQIPGKTWQEKKVYFRGKTIETQGE